MGLEETSVEHATPVCENCGVTLEDAEAIAVMESEGPNLCSVCADDAGAEADSDASADE